MSRKLFIFLLLALFVTVFTLLNGWHFINDLPERVTTMLIGIPTLIALFAAIILVLALVEWLALSQISPRFKQRSYRRVYLGQLIGGLLSIGLIILIVFITDWDFPSKDLSLYFSIASILLGGILGYFLGAENWAELASNKKPRRIR